jgi:hypothetical protein
MGSLDKLFTPPDGPPVTSSIHSDATLTHTSIPYIQVHTKYIRPIAEVLYHHPLGTFLKTFLFNPTLPYPTRTQASASLLNISPGMWDFASSFLDQSKSKLLTLKRPNPYLHQFLDMLEEELNQARKCIEDRHSLSARTGFLSRSAGSRHGSQELLMTSAFLLVQPRRGRKAAVRLSLSALPCGDEEFFHLVSTAFARLQRCGSSFGFCWSWVYG